MSSFWTSDNPLPNTSGIYIIYFDLYDGGNYVGSTIDFHKRFLAHKSALLRNKSNCVRLQHAFNKYFEDFGMSFHIIEFCSVDKLAKRELYHIKAMGTTDPDFGYNVALDTIMPMLGRKHSEATKKLMSKNSTHNKSNLGRTLI